MAYVSYVICQLVIRMREEVQPITESSGFLGKSSSWIAYIAMVIVLPEFRWRSKEDSGAEHTPPGPAVRFTPVKNVQLRSYVVWYPGCRVVVVIEFSPAGKRYYDIMTSRH